MYTLLLTLMLVPQSGGAVGTIHTEKMLFSAEGNGHQNCINTGQEWLRSYSDLTSKKEGTTRIEAHAVCLAGSVNAEK